jgi:hypothetical protein
MVEGPIVGPLRVVGEAAAGKLTAFQVIAQAIAAHTLSRARFVAAVAPFHVLGLLAFHGVISFY